MDKYTVIIILSTLGFFALAAILLIPVYLFLQKEERLSEKWTGDAIAKSIEERLQRAEEERRRGDSSGRDT